MKQTSIKKLSEVYNALRDPHNAPISNEQAAELIQEVIRAEAMTPVKAGKFNIYNYVADDEIRPAMNGVFLDRGNKVASNGHILIAIKEEYEPEFEGRVIYKDGSFYEMKRMVKDENGHYTEVAQLTSYDDEDGRHHQNYPKWESVIPNTGAGGYLPYKFDREKFFKWIDGLRVAHKAKYGKGNKWETDWFVKVGPCGFKAELFNRLIEAMDFLGVEEIYLHEDGRRAGVVKSDKGVCILMPVLLAEDFNEDKPNHVILG